MKKTPPSTTTPVAGRPNQAESLKAAKRTEKPKPGKFPVKRNTPGRSM